MVLARVEQQLFHWDLGEYGWTVGPRRSLVWGRLVGGLEHCRERVVLVL